MSKHELSRGAWTTHRRTLSGRVTPARQGSRLTVQRRAGKRWTFELPEGGPEPLLKALIDGGAGIETLAIERPGLHDAFVAIAGDAAAAAMGAPSEAG